LLAPWKDFCFVTGDFNDWQQDSAFYMKRTPDSLRFWLRINNLTPHKEYIFQYFIDGNLPIADPYSDKVSDPNDQYIDSSTYPNLIPYPTGKTTEIASVLETGRSQYPWENSTFSPPSPKDLVIYEILIRDFTTFHDYPSVEDTLSYLKNLGVNTIELMPVMEFEGNSSWGYNPDFPFAPDKYYGTREGLKHLIDYAHSIGIAVILDIVLNHQFGSSPLARLYWDKANSRPAANNLWFNPIPKHPYNVGNDFNHESPYTRAFCERLLKYWIQEYHADGFRFDLSKGFTQTNSYPDNMTLWNQYDGSRISTLDNYLAAVKSVKSDGIVILEHFANNDEQTRLSNDGMLLWGNLNSNYSKAAEGFISGNLSDLSYMSYQKLGWNDPHLVGYMESHDEERVMYNTITYGNASNPDYLVRDTTLALKRMALAATFFFTIPGPKMIWQFGELGYDYSINYPCGSDCRLSEKPIRWDYYGQWRRKYLFNIYSSLIHLKADQKAFKTTDFATDLTGGLKSIHLNDSSMNVTVLGNFNVYGGQIEPDFQNKGTWFDYFSGDSLAVTDTAALITLLPGEYHIYTTIKLKKPLFTGIDEPGSLAESGNNVRLFPNPSSGKVWIKSAEKIIRIEIYSLTGICEATYDHPGSFDISLLQPGMYLVKVLFTNRPAEVLKLSKM
ncbi:MAG: alpha-amylase family glycosyl hydrolase, partial [Bacteroidota bacterium]|nr:alpha-amylase family glycosyl hydrolase [Bacteroidota bacterium]